MANAKRTYDVDAVWVELDPTTLVPAQATAYQSYKSLYRDAKDARKRFEAVMRDGQPIPQGQKLVFAYNFGKLKTAVVPDDGKGERKPSPKAMSLTDYLATMSASGGRA